MVLNTQSYMLNGWIGMGWVGYRPTLRAPDGANNTWTWTLTLKNGDQLNEVDDAFEAVAKDD